MPSHRQSGQSTADDLRGRDYRQELEERERAVRDKGGVKEKRSFTGKTKISLKINFEILYHSRTYKFINFGEFMAL